MLTKMESRQCTPSVIARLMGLDELSPHQPVHKKQKVLSENYLRRVATIGLRGKRSSHEYHLFRICAEEQKEFKDAFEVHGKLKREEDCNLRVEKGKSKLSLSAVEEVHDAQEVVDSIMDLFMKYPQEPESFITKHLLDSQGIPHHLQSGCLTVLKSSNAFDAGKTDICSISGRETDQERAKLLRKLETGLVTDSCGEHVLGDGYKILRSRKEPINLPTKIVVLKPKLGKKENAARCFPSSSSCRVSHSINKNKEFLCPEGGNLRVEEEEKKNLAKDVEPVRLRFRISQEISRQTRQGKNNLFTKMKTFSSSSSFDRKNHSGESYVAREARKEILERSKTTKMFQEVEVASWNKTLVEMLATPDQESSPSNSDFGHGEHGHNSQNGLRHSHNLFMRPPEKRLQHRFRKQRHNQKDGSEYRNSGSSSMVSQSVPCSESRYSHSVLDDCVLQGQLKRKLEEKDTCEQVYMDFKSSNSYHSYPDSEHRGTTQEGEGVQGPQKNKLEEKDLSEQSSVATKSSVNCVASASMVIEISENHKEQHLNMTDCMLLLEDGYFSSQVPDASPLQDMSIGIFKEDSVSSFGSCTDPEYLVNLEEAYQHSPNSVLEPPIEKEISSSSLCCRGVDSNLHGLQLQLELLKSDSSEAYSEGAGMIVSSDDDSEEGLVSVSGENEEFTRIFSVEDSRDFSYLADIFTEAGFHVRNSGTSYETWHSPECPISPAVFEMLEKKYGKHMSWRRSERRLLFDRINSVLMAILKPSIGIRWKKPLSTRLCFGKNLDMIEEELWMFLGHQEKQANWDSSVQVLGKDDGWLELGDDIEVIVREIENSLIGQLSEEIVSMESF